MLNFMQNRYKRRIKKKIPHVIVLLAHTVDYATDKDKTNKDG